MSLPQQESWLWNKHLLKHVIVSAIKAVIRGCDIGYICCNLVTASISKCALASNVKQGAVFYMCVLSGKAVQLRTHMGVRSGGRNKSGSQTLTGQKINNILAHNFSHVSHFVWFMEL